MAIFVKKLLNHLTFQFSFIFCASSLILSYVRTQRVPQIGDILRVTFSSYTDASCTVCIYWQFVMHYSAI